MNEWIILLKARICVEADVQVYMRIIKEINRFLSVVN